MFGGCSSLSNIKPLKNWNVLNGNNFSGMFGGCSSFLDIKVIQNWKISNDEYSKLKQFFYFSFINYHDKCKLYI